MIDQVPFLRLRADDEIEPQGWLKTLPEARALSSVAEFALNAKKAKRLVSLVMPTFRFTYRSRRPPSEVRSWWVDLPDDCSTRDPREQPHRIVTVKRTETGRELITYWRRALGRERALRETLVVEEPFRWSFDVLPAGGFGVHDEFAATPEGAGARLDIESTVTFTTPATRILGPLLTPLVRRMLRRGWADAVAVCDEETSGISDEVRPSG